MARGFESKSVADQHESARGPRPARDPEALVDPALIARRRRLELSRVDIVRRLESAQAEGHREMLRRALAALEGEIASLD